MVTNIMRFTQQLQQQQSLGIMIRVGSLMEAESWIDVSASTSTSLLIILDDRLGGELLDERVRYLREYITARGAVVGIGYYSDGSEPQVRMALLAGCSYVQVDITKWSQSEAREYLRYSTRLAHGLEACLEAVIGDFQNGNWKSEFTTEFDIQKLVSDTRLDAIGVRVPDGVVTDWKLQGVTQLNEDFLHAVALKSQAIVNIHGVSLGSSWVGTSQKYAKHPYREVVGISEHALMRVSEKGVHYLTLDIDIRAAYDLCYRGIIPGDKAVTPQMMPKEYRKLITSYIRECNKLIAKTYAI